MALEFCEKDDALIQINLVNGVLIKECKLCGELYDLKDEDRLIFKAYINDNKKQITTPKIQKNIAEDNVGVLVDIPCKKCKKPYVKLFVSDDLENSFVTCDCGFIELNNYTPTNISS